jgi:hypothetical protein
MGLYDNFAIKYPLPISEHVPSRYKSYILATIDQDNFQSKDFDCMMESYFIDNKGFLYLEEYPPFESDDFEIKRIKKYFHGHLRVYNWIFLDEEDPKNQIWLEYDLKFTDGLLVCATMISPTKEDFDGLH